MVISFLGDGKMPHKIILDDIFEEIFDDISYLKLNSYVHFEEEDD